MEKAIEYTLKGERKEFEVLKVHCSDDVAKWSKKLFGDSIDVYESVWALFFNYSNTLIGYAKLSQGGIASAPIDIRLLAKYAIDVLASGVIIVHNHPGGSVTPSTQDKELAKNVKKGLALLNVTFLDSIIVSGNGEYCSMLDEGFII